MSELRRSVDQLRQSLDAIEPVLNKGAQTSYLEEFKATLDRVRTNVLAVSTTTNPVEYPEAITKFRLRRAAEVCQGVLSGLSDRTITRGTPGFARLQTAVDETLEALERLKNRA
jgi:hypothetical protein